MDLCVFIGQREGGPHMSAPAVRTREFGCLVTFRTLTCRQYGALVQFMLLRPTADMEAHGSSHMLQQTVSDSSSRKRWVCACRSTIGGLCIAKIYV